MIIQGYDIDSDCTTPLSDFLPGVYGVLAVFDPAHGQVQHGLVALVQVVSPETPASCVLLFDLPKAKLNIHFLK